MPRAEIQVGRFRGFFMLESVRNTPDYNAQVLCQFATLRPVRYVLAHPAFMSRILQFFFITSFLAFSWLAMQAVHECGHVLAAIATGGTVQKVVLHPLELSRTDVAPNPQALLVVWAGPLFGAILPLPAWGVAERCRWPHIFMWRFFSGFCLVANGVYLVGGALTDGADPGDLMALGVPKSALIAIGLIGAVCGLWLWNQQGHYFGIGKPGGKVSKSATTTAVILLIAIATVEWIFGSR